MTITERIDAVTRIPPEYLREDPPAPPSAKIELTSRCDYRCDFCASSQNKRTKGDMTWDDFLRLTEMLRDAGVRELGLFYLGESFLLDWLPDAIRYVKHEQEFPYVFLTTNGTSATPDKVEACMSAGLDSLKFSLNWADEEQFSAIARVKTSFFRQATTHIKAAKAVRDAGNYSCGLYASYILYDGEQGEKMGKRVDDIGRFVDEVYELPLYNQGGHIGREGWEFSQGNRGRVGALRDPLPCWAVFTEAHVTYDLQLSACCFDHDGKFVTGNLREVDFFEAWRSEKFRELRRAHLTRDVTGTVCEDCLR